MLAGQNTTMMLILCAMVITVLWLFWRDITKTKTIMDQNKKIDQLDELCHSRLQDINTSVKQCQQQYVNLVNALPAPPQHPQMSMSNNVPVETAEDFESEEEPEQTPLDVSFQEFQEKRKESSDVEEEEKKKEPSLELTDDDLELTEKDLQDIQELSIDDELSEVDSQETHGDEVDLDDDGDVTEFSFTTQKKKIPSPEFEDAPELNHNAKDIINKIEEDNTKINDEVVEDEEENDDSNQEEEEDSGEEEDSIEEEDEDDEEDEQESGVEESKQDNEGESVEEEEDSGEEEYEEEDEEDEEEEDEDEDEDENDTTQHTDDDDEPMEVDRNDLEKMSVPKLKLIAKDNGVTKLRGKKSELIDRIMSVLEAEAEAETEA